MNIIYLTFSDNINVNSSGVHIDLMKEFQNQGHQVYVVCPLERRYKKKTYLDTKDGINVLRVWTFNLKKANLIEKGVGTVLVEYQFKKAINEFLHNINFDLILYSTPPITFPQVIRCLKQLNPNAVSYLVLKDIFPQNAVDLKMISKYGILYRFFRWKEKKLYNVSDYIGCMSPANVSYLLINNPQIDPFKVEIAPNSVINYKLEAIDKNSILKKYGLPVDKPIFLYGGNLGKPQGIDFLIECLDMNKFRDDCFFVIVGGGTEYEKIVNWYNNNKIQNCKVFSTIRKEDYDKLVRACDVGLIFLNHSFTIPNYPARLLSYLQFHLPIIAATDLNSDVGTIAEKNGYGYWCESNSVEDFTKCIDKMLMSNIKEMGEKGYNYYLANYQTVNTYNKIIKHLSL
jgi:hypothetical protein